MSQNVIFKQTSMQKRNHEVKMMMDIVAVLVRGCSPCGLMDVVVLMWVTTYCWFVSVMGDLFTISISGLSGISENREWVGLCSCSVVVHPFPASCLKQGFWMCPSRIPMYGETMISPLTCLLLHSGQPALFACTFYLYLGFTLGHWVCGTETGLSILFLYNVQQRHIWNLKFLVVLYVMPITHNSDNSSWGCVAICARDGDVIAINVLP